RRLVDRGWTVGNHTLSHRPLHALRPSEVDRQLAENQAELEREGLRPLRWIAYPGGGAGDVGPDVERWLRRNPEFQAAFAAGGVNFAPARTEWLRMGVAAQRAAQLSRLVWRNVEATRGARQALHGRNGRLARGASG